MGNLVLCYKNEIDTAVLSGGSWISKLPLDNMKNYVQSKVSRSSDAFPSSSQFTATWSKDISIGGLALANHNIELDGEIRIRLYDALGFNLFDSNWFPVWPTVYDPDSLEWEDDNFWTGQAKLEDLENVRWTFTYLFDELQTARSIKIEISDPLNSNGFIDIGRPHIAGVAWEPRVNMSEGAALYYETNSTKDKALSGTNYFDPKNQYRVIQFNLNNMSQDESMSRAFDMQRLVGIDKEIIFIWDRDDTIHQIRRRFVGTLRQLNAIEVANYERHKTSFAGEESL